MRLKHLTISGFRGFAQTESIDLDADAVIVSGANGRGKTSMFDAILWALTGSVERLHGEPADIVSRYSPSGEARVELELDDSGSSLLIVRRFDGESRLSLETSEGTVMGTAAETALIDLLWPEARAASEPSGALSRSLTRATYLQQDVVREFVEADDEQQRFSVVSELVGVGRVTELQRQLETSRTSWTRATNRLDEDLKPIRNQIAALEERLRRLTGAELPSLDQAAFAGWLHEIRQLVSLDDSGLELTGAPAIELALRASQDMQRQNDRASSSLQRLLAHLDAGAPDAVPVEALRAQVHASELIAAEASTLLQTVQESVAAELRRQAELRDEAESLRVLAQLALRHLGDRCPVCDQSYDIEATRLRLQLQTGEQDGAGAREPSPNAESAALQLEAAQRQLAADEAALRAAERSEALRNSWEQTRDSLASEAGLETTTNIQEQAGQALTALDAANTRLQELQRLGEQYLLQLARFAEQDQRAEVDDQLRGLREILVAREVDLQARATTGELANTLLTGLRGASTRIVTEELNRIGPLLQRIYAGVEPHPSFRAVRFLTSISRGHGRVWTTVIDEAADKVVNEPSIVLSSSQLNVLAVSTFLSLNLAIDTLPLQVVAMDDPLQSLDTVNLLGLADLIRRVRASRQVLVSTHDDRLADLLARKLRPVTADSRTVVIRFDAWTRDGPVLEQYDIPTDAPPLKLVAAS